MQFGLGSYACAWAIGVPGYRPAKPLDIFGFIALASSLGYQLVQVADNLPLHSLTKTQQQNLQELLQNTAISLEVGTRGIQTDHLRSYLELAKTYSSTLLRVVVDSENHHPSPEEVIRLLASQLAEFEASEITLAIENHDRFSAKTLLHIIQTLASKHVGICLDTVNSFGSLEGPEIVIETLAPYTVNLHIKDFDIRRLGHNMGFELFGTPAGQGRLDIPKVIRQVAAYGNCHSAILELWPGYETNLETTIDKERRWLYESTQYLRKELA